MLFSFCYKTTDGRTWCDFIESKDWHTALDCVSDFQGFQCGAVAEVIEATKTGESIFRSEPPDCPVYLRNHPAARMSV
jgi:hypothetical protein